MSRAITDKLMEVSKALPAAAANNSSDALELGEGYKGENYEVELAVPALPSLVDAKTVIFTFQDSADGTNFAAVPELATLTVTGGGGVGAAAATRRIRLPGTCRRYLRFNQAVLAAGGDNTAVSATMRLLF